ncbi:MAG: hypothetical protein HOP15_17995 [Planctomycetes bacterium]|nr:hypothetical protein [Planctomycetota bacterium]
MSEPAPSPLLRLRRLLGRVRRRFAVDNFDVFVRPVPSAGGFEAPAGYEFRFGTAADVERCDPLHTELDERERREGVRRLASGHRVVLGLAGETIVFTMWVNPRNLNVPGLLKRALGPRQWFIYKAFTSPAHRGKKLYESGMRFVLAEMRAAGLEELVGYAHVEKRVSRKGLAALDFTSIGRATRIDWPGFETTRLSRQLSARFPREVARSGVMAAETGTPTDP